MLYWIIGCLFLSLSTRNLVRGDTFADCRYEDAIGTWRFDVSENRDDCAVKSPTLYSVKINLEYPNIAIDELGHEGTWTTIYNQGFEVDVAHRKWLVKYVGVNKTLWYCDRGMPISSHDALVRQWACSEAHKIQEQIIPSENRDVNVNSSPTSDLELDQLYQHDQDFVDKINAAQNAWVATEYPEDAKYTLREHLLRSGGWSRKPFERPQVNHRMKQMPSELRQEIERLPKDFTWKDRKPAVVTPVRAQLHCGSCYAFASTAAMESRIRLWSNFSKQPILAPQDVLDCSPYSEGCDGGFPYLIAGKYAQDFGITTEECMPYKAKATGQCNRKGCERFYSTNYHYIGGYYGTSNAELMQVELIKNGPFPVGFEVYPDFINYKSGVYHHTHITSDVNKFDPLIIMNHAVLLVGYGVDAKSGLPYWEIKNSWGTTKGDHGYFKLLRGVDECGIESAPVAFDPIL